MSPIARASALGLALLLASPGAWAQTGAVVPFTGDGVPSNTLDGITSLALSEVDIRSGWELSMLHEGDLETGCGDSESCLNDLCAAQGYDLVVSGSVRKTPSEYTLRLRLFRGASRAFERTVDGRLDADPVRMVDEMAPLITELLTGEVPAPEPAEQPTETDSGPTVGQLLLDDDEGPGVERGQGDEPDDEARPPDDDDILTIDFDVDPDELARRRLEQRKQEDRQRIEREREQRLERIRSERQRQEAQRKEEQQRRAAAKRKAKEDRKREDAARRAAAAQGYDRAHRDAEARRDGGAHDDELHIDDELPREEVALATDDGVPEQVEGASPQAPEDLWGYGDDADTAAGEAVTEDRDRARGGLSDPAPGGSPIGGAPSDAAEDVLDDPRIDPRDYDDPDTIDAELAEAPRPRRALEPAMIRGLYRGQLRGRVGYQFYHLLGHGLQLNLEVGVQVHALLTLNLGIGAWEFWWDLDPSDTRTERQLVSGIPLSLGITVGGARVPKRIAINPFGGLDILMAIYSGNTRDRSTGEQLTRFHASYGLRFRGGLDVMVHRNVGFFAQLELGFTTADEPQPVTIKSSSLVPNPDGSVRERGPLPRTGLAMGIGGGVVTRF
jgi:hypothetical protein